MTEETTFIFKLVATESWTSDKFIATSSITIQVINIELLVDLGMGI